METKEVVLTALIVCGSRSNQYQTLWLYFNNLVLFVWFGCDTEEQTESEPFKVGNSKNGDQHKEAVTSLSLHFWCSLLKYNLALVLFLVLFDHQLLQVCIQTKQTELC